MLWSDKDMTQMEKDTRITFRVPMNLRSLVREFVSLDLHMNESDFYRHAAIEKIQRDAPELYRKQFVTEEFESQEEELEEIRDG